MAQSNKSPSADASAPADAAAAALALGARIRTLRREQGLTLTEAAAKAELSHSFLSQVERGLERLSMASLFRIARALGTTQQDLLTEDRPPRSSGRSYVFRGGTGSPLDAGGGPVRVLAQDRPRFLPMILEGTFDDGLWWQHDEEEFLYVLEGVVTVALDDEEHLLRAGDATYYEGGVRHQWRTPPGERCRLLVVKEGRHAPEA